MWHAGSLVSACGLLSRGTRDLRCGMRDLLVAACGLLSCGMRDLVPLPGIKPGPPALGAQSLTHWTTREVPIFIFFTFLHFPSPLAISFLLAQFPLF